jgi:hypothetical protein
MPATDKDDEDGGRVGSAEDFGVEDSPDWSPTRPVISIDADATGPLASMVGCVAGWAMVANRGTIGGDAGDIGGKWISAGPFDKALAPTNGNAICSLLLIVADDTACDD